MRISDWSSDVCSSDLGFEGYKPLSPEAAVAAAPDVLLISTRSLDLLGGRDGLRAIPEIALTPAGREGRVVVIDGLLLDRKSVVSGKSVSVRVDLGGRRIIKKKKDIVRYTSRHN